MKIIKDKASPERITKIIKILEFRMRITQIMICVEFNAIIMKIIIIIEFILRIMTNYEHHIIPFDNNKKNENLVISCDIYENHENI